MIPGADKIDAHERVGEHFQYAIKGRNNLLSDHGLNPYQQRIFKILHT